MSELDGNFNVALRAGTCTILGLEFIERLESHCEHVHVYMYMYSQMYVNGNIGMLYVHMYAPLGYEYKPFPWQDCRGPQ